MLYVCAFHPVLNNAYTYCSREITRISIKYTVNVIMVVGLCDNLFPWNEIFFGMRVSFVVRCWFNNAFRFRNVPFYEYATVRLHNFVNHTLNKATNPNYCRYRTTPCMFLQMRNLAVPDSYVYMYLKRNAMTFNFKQ